jgi:hypothetical protein
MSTQLAKTGWIIVAYARVPQREIVTYFVGVETEREAKGKVQEERHVGIPLDMMAGKLSENALGALQLKQGELRDAPDHWQPRLGEPRADS